MDHKHFLGTVDYVVIAFSLIISVAIGVKFRHRSTESRTMKNYAMAGRNMTIFPVVMSISVTLMSSIQIIANPVETYRFGMQLTVRWFGLVFGTIISTYVFIPVYFNLGVSTIYEFLELRYGKITRYTVSFLFILQMVNFISAMLYAPVLAISAVTDLSVEMSIIIFGLVCSFYCSIGGLKAVLWTDVFQGALMIICIVVLYVQGVKEAGGLTEIFRISIEGQRWNLLNLDMDFTTRYTFWNAFLRGLLGSMAYFGASQVEVQRVQSLSTVARARTALLWSLVPTLFIFGTCQFYGMVLYAIFYTCDPVKDGERTGLTRYDQVVPYYIVTRLSWIPGLTGVCMAGIFSGSLSSISSAINSLSTVTVVDFILPVFGDRLTESRRVYIAKALTMVYGLACICLTYVISRADSLAVIIGTLAGMMEGPLLAIFLVAVLTRKGSEKCILFALLAGFCLVSWIGYGSIFSGYRHPTLPLSTEGCDSTVDSNIFSNTTCSSQNNCTLQSTTKNIRPEEYFILYRISHAWISTIGCVVTLFCIFLAISITGWKHNVIPSDSKCLSPVTRYWIKNEHLPQQLEFNEDVELKGMTKPSISTTIHQID
ncbi:hypothetical protein JTE90_024246 [Oedothorax gibbosus]|uniref:Sodium-dependent multivitamin transporter n=1 Tax=Oedothorax gibbosus TaxID=931172 RepID=A0AAV6TZ40_9ARAC|nr:hypothetical protein JTE90_024246 [Oedothorax gibbosus]